MKRVGIVFLIFGVIVLGAIFLMRQAPRVDRGSKLFVVATTGIVADAVKRVAGDRAEVVALMGPGVDPHLYHARESDVQRLADADIIFYNGLHLEGKMGQIFERMHMPRMAQQKKVCAVSDGIDRALLRASEYQGAYDPHVWFDVTLWMKCVEQIRDCFIQHDPAHQQAYRHNAEVYMQELSGLDTYIRLRVAQLPEKRRVLITAHDAFSYFGRAYGFTIVSLQGISTDSEIGVGDVTRVVNYIISNDIPALFAEASLPQSNVAAVQQAVRAHGKVVGIGPELYSDTLGEPGTIQETYVGMVRSVVDRIVDALQGKAHHE